MTKKPTQSTATLWARFRFSVIGSLLSAPLPRGELKAAIQSLAEKIWTHPVNGRGCAVRRHHDRTLVLQGAK